MPWVLALLLLAPSSALAQQEAPRLMSDSREYCAELSNRFAALESGAPALLRALADEGRQLCLEGQTRIGIAKLRRALKEAQRGE
ncbi:MAG: hypothetical protein ING09_07735 [Roseomonas sp.]|jgi:hypothetical protein|nr:hypothetical protein [Roseomonas sp.]MCA3286427.1 hypothetical protein [Roseomonas sp.]MCA3291547.1 hypothetical protein [Roseomonas sp.]MCA3294071.1 hypothetical protein [Roseomonas sp.]MCA3297593.1 hypothetical protein [Roseomonas sp.]